MDPSDPLITQGTDLAPATDDVAESASRPVVKKLFKTAMKGGILTLTNRELILGEGWLGSRNVQRFPLKTLARLDVELSPADRGLHRSWLLRFVWMDGRATVADNIGPIAARRIQMLIEALRRPAMRQFVS